MRDTWLVKNYEHVLRRSAPTVNDTVSVYPYVWVDIVTDTAYVTQSAGVWTQKAPDVIINTPVNNIYVINTIDATPETVTFQGENVTIGGEEATW